MWDTSKSPARVRTAMCSSAMPVYSTGMSQPPNSTIRAPCARCRAWSGVFFSAPVAGCVMWAGRNLSEERYYAARPGVKGPKRCNNSPHRRMNHRREIDGLRAIAVLSILFFHADFPGFKEGYRGVDMFFVISGFLITGILLREGAAGTFTLAKYYRRRARR